MVSLTVKYSSSFLTASLIKNKLIKTSTSFPKTEFLQTCFDLVLVLDQDCQNIKTPYQRRCLNARRLLSIRGCLSIRRCWPVIKSFPGHPDLVRQAAADPLPPYNAAALCVQRLSACVQLCESVFDAHTLNPFKPFNKDQQPFRLRAFGSVVQSFQNQRQSLTCVSEWSCASTQYTCIIQIYECCLYTLTTLSL